MMQVRFVLTHPMFGITDGARKVTGRDGKVLPRTIVYDPELTLRLPAAVSAASGMNAIAHCVESFWADGRTPVTLALASEASLSHPLTHGSWDRTRCVRGRP